MSPKTTTCTYHCSACGLHFHSLNAFDARRQGEYASNDPELGRHCVHPLDIEGQPLGVLTEDGVCKVYEDAEHPGSRAGVSTGVTIWTHAGDLARLRAALDAREFARTRQEWRRAEDDH
jgi:hypothetical protein